MEWVRKATGSAVVMTDPSGRVLLLRRAYPPFDWVLPGGNAEAGESPVETATREVEEETGVKVELERMTGVYYQDDHQAGEFIHFVFAASLPDDVPIRPDPGEVADHGLFPPNELPEPISASTRQRLLDALAPEPRRLPVTLAQTAES